MQIKPTKLQDLRIGSKNIYIEVQIIEKLNEREVYVKKDQETHNVADFLIGDETGTYYLTVWDKKIKKLEKKIGKVIYIKNGYVTTFKNQLKLNIGLYGTWEYLDKKLKVKKESLFPRLKVEELKNNMSNVNVIVKVLRVEKRPRILKFNGAEHEVFNAVVGDHSAIINLSFLDEMATLIEPDSSYELRNALVSQYQNHLQLIIGNFGEIKKIKHKPIKVNVEKLL